MREKANVLLDMCRDGMLDPMDVLENVLTNYMSAGDADDFAVSEYLDDYDDYDQDEPDDTFF